MHAPFHTGQFDVSCDFGHLQAGQKKQRTGHVLPHPFEKLLADQNFSRAVKDRVRPGSFSGITRLESMPSELRLA